MLLTSRSAEDNSLVTKSNLASIGATDAYALRSSLIPLTDPVQSRDRWLGSSSIEASVLPDFQVELDAAQQLTQHYLNRFFTNFELQSNINSIFGSHWNADVLNQLTHAWINNDFSHLPGIEVRLGSELNGANGAFSSTTNRIYLSSDYLIQQSGNSEMISRVLLEETGHWIDSQINCWDAAGDEGDLFQHIVRGVQINPQEWLSLQVEDDFATITLDGITLLVEQSSTLETGRNQNGLLENFGIGTDNLIYHRRQTNFSSGWGDWSSMGWAATELEVVQTSDQRLALFAIGLDGTLWHRWQTAPNGGWSGWQNMGKQGTEVEAARNADGRLEIFVVGTDNRLWQRWQTIANSDWSDWTYTDFNATEIDLTETADGRLSVFAIAANDASIWQGSRVVQNGSWTSWQNMGLQAADLDVSRNRDGGLELYAVGLDNTIWQRWYTATSNWSNWTDTGLQGVDVEVSQSQDGRLEVFAVDTQQNLWHRWHTNLGGTWSRWEDTGGRAIIELDVAQNADGRLETVVVLTGNSIGHRYQVAPNSDWVNWSWQSGLLNRESLTFRDAEVNALVRQLSADGSLSRNDVLDILRDVQDAASWDETALVSSSEWLDLRLIVNNSSRFNLQDHVRWLTDRIVRDATINMSSDQFEANLVGRWFLGTIAPTPQFITRNNQGQPVAYNLTHVAVRGSLFGSSGQARIGDIDQGRLGDCTFLAALGATFGRQSNDSGNAISSVINSMIIDNGDNTYTIRFFANGAAEYVTVDHRLAIYGGRFFGASANGSANPNNPHNILWAPLVERAYAQWREWRDLQPGYSLIGNGAHLVPVLQYVTGRNATHYDIAGVTFDQLLVAVNNNQAVMAARYNSVSTTDIVGGHAYSVTNVYINNGEQRVVVRNPWGADGGQTPSGINDGFIDLSFASFRSQFEGIAIA